MAEDGSYIEAGRGQTTLVFLHGIGGNADAWTRQLDWLARTGRARGLAWNLPGYGGTPLVDPYNWAGLAAALNAFINRHGVERPVLVGHSMGGMLAQEYACRYPAGPGALVLSATTSSFGRPDGDWQQAFVADRLKPLEAGQGMAALAKALVPAMLGRDPNPDGVASALSAMGRVPEETYRHALRNLVTFNRRDELHAISVPTLLIAGEEDRTAPAEVMRRMAERIAGADFVLLPKAGHLANMEQPGAFNDALDGFLGNLEACR
ncbi:alpha/beta fold hydrolase [Oceanibacterium hippocampi]|uniref:3-oxoadipate enol-lactonase 2 n=1 Tax=Oceanibacterium hippocampi TaxID=745714 RepID=A0A1Y5TUM3_9PROT|nr:alpha/beta hydrolase [Oceanibacterium hippocampi]SLN72882.1 3-oxoadipate enol-lactonase 2 [Oceanibacterium hippocampi]